MRFVISSVLLCLSLSAQAFYPSCVVDKTSFCGPWAATTAYERGRCVIPTAGVSGYVFEKTDNNQENSGGSEPDWAACTTTCSDGDVTWTRRTYNTTSGYVADQDTTTFNTYYNSIVSLMNTYNLNCIRLNSYSAAVVNQAWYAARLEALLDTLSSNSMKAIYVVGNPTNAAWDETGDGAGGAAETYDGVYGHSALYGVIYGDEPTTAASVTSYATGVAAIKNDYPSMKVMTSMIAEEFSVDDHQRNIQSIAESPAGTYTITTDYDMMGINLSGAAIVIAGTSAHNDNDYAYSSGVESSTIVVTNATSGRGNQAGAGGTIYCTSCRELSWYKSAWASIANTMRLARYYPVRETAGLRDADYNASDVTNPPSTVWSIMEQANATDYLAYMGSLGETNGGDGISKDAANFRRQSTAKENIVQAHLAMANGARGLLWFAMQTHLSGAEDILGFTTKALAPVAARDSSYPIDGISTIGGYIESNSTLLENHDRAGFYIASDNADVEVYPRIDPTTGFYYGYVVNTDTENAENATVTVGNPALVNSATDIYTGTTVTGSSGALSVSLAAGQGMFLKLNQGPPTGYRFRSLHSRR